jgi:pimeloyl-ACP methyl ester carboxylesterase
MNDRIGPLRAEVTHPESEKFTAPLLLVHGLWERARAWRRFAGYLAHRGWRCIAVERRDDVVDVEAHVADLRAAIAALDAPPVVLGHDLGALLALRCADTARAVVALAPLVGRPLAEPSPAFAAAGTWLARRRSGFLRAPRGRWRSAYPNRDVAEPSALLRQIRAGEPVLAPPSGAAPCTVFAVQADTVTAAAAAEALARHVHADLQLVPGLGHAALDAPGWEAVVAAVHRWIIQHLGTDLLALYEESMWPE